MTVFILRETMVVLYMKQTNEIRVPTATYNFEMMWNSQSTLVHEFDSDVLLFKRTADDDAVIRSPSNHLLPIQLNFARFTAHNRCTLKPRMWLSTDQTPPPVLSVPIRRVSENVLLIQRWTVTVAAIVWLLWLCFKLGLIRCCNYALCCYE